MKNDISRMATIIKDEHSVYIELIKEISCLTTELRVVFCEYFGENLSCYKDKTVLWRNVTRNICTSINGMGIKIMAL